MKKYLLLCLLPLFSFPLRAQEGCEIKLILKDSANDTIWFGQNYGKREIPDFFGLRQEDGSYLLKTDKPLPSGMYSVIYKRTPTTYKSFQCWLADGERKFTIETKLSNPYNGSVTGSKENELLFSYNYQFQSLDYRLDDIIDHWRYQPSAENYRKRVELENELHQYQKDFIAKNPGTLMAKLVQETMFPVPPVNAIKSKNWEEQATERWVWQKQRYFENMDISSESFMRHEQWLTKVDFYLFRLPPPSPDTTIALIDDIFDKLEANPGAYQYYSKYLINSLAKMSQYRLDEVFVHMVKTYVQTGKATWPTDNEKQRSMDDAARMERLFEGNKGPDVTLYTKDESAVSLYGIDAPYTLMVYWMPDCGHCKKELPLIMDAYQTFKERGLKILSVCGKSSYDVQTCWDFAAENKFPDDWLLVADPTRRSNITNLYNIRSYPRVIIFDKDKNIVFKRSGSMSDWQLDAVLNRLHWSAD